MPKTSLFDGIKNRLRSRSPAPRHTVAEGHLTGTPQAPGPPINATQDAEPSASALEPAETLPPTALSDPYGIAREKYGLFRLTAPATGSLADGARLDTNHIDIVAVHGLNGAADKTWTHENGNLWLKDLAKDFPGARVFTYGYASEIYFTLGMGNIATFSLSLLNDLKRERISKTDQARPIIFICHSMGGIVVKNALITAKLDDEDFGNITKSVAGIAFLSTPHRGSSQAGFPALLASVANVALSGTSRYVGSMRLDLIKSLEKESESLNDISTNFRNQMGNMKIASFIELDKTPPANKLIVDGFSGIMGVPRERIVPMQGCDHRTICRFPGTYSKGYKAVLGILQEWVSHFNEACLESLSFLEINYRRQEADQAYENTCAWIFGHPAYTEWSAKNCELLWIQGNPGSGKSTLMSFIYDEFHKNIPQSREVVLDYFFHGRGSTLQKTRVGMFRTLLHQLYHQVHFIRPQIQAVFKEKERFGKAGIGWEWHPKECERLFSEVITCAAQSRNITLFVDALDEAGIDGSDLASYFHELNGKLRIGKGNARICISCRKYPVLASNLCLKVYVEKENKGDIKTYVERKFESEIQSHGMAMSAQDEFKKLRTAVVERSQNTFQWVYLVVPLIIKLRRDGLSLALIMEELDKVPQGLDKVYEHILTNVIELRYRPKTLLLMQWVCLAVWPLSVEEIRFAMASDDAYIDERRQSCSKLKDFVESGERMEMLITSMSGGLVETIWHKDDTYNADIVDKALGDYSTVQFIHHSINDFLLSGGLKVLAQYQNPTTRGDTVLSSSADGIGQSHNRLCRSCINYLKLEDVSYNNPYNYKVYSPTQPFVRYATQYWLAHAERAESYGVSQEYLIQRLGLHPDLVFFDWEPSYLRFRFAKRDCLKSSLLHIACIANIQSIVIQVLKADSLTDLSTINDRDYHSNKPLYYATIYGHCELVKIILDAEDPTGATSKDRATEFLIPAVKHGQERVVRELLVYGVDLRGNTQVARNALIEAVENMDIMRTTVNGDVSLIKLLLDYGADPNARGDFHKTAIEEAITSSVVHTAAVKLLLESGANANGSCSPKSTQLKGLMRRLSDSQWLLPNNNSLDETLELDGTVLQVAAALDDEDSAAIVTKMLLEKGAHVNEGGFYGTALQIASARGSTLVMKLLLKKGAQVNEGGLYGTALQIASARGNTSVVKLLLKKGANIDGLGNSLTPLQVASSLGHSAVVEFLLKNGASVNLQQHGSPSALQFAAYRWDTSLVQLLLDDGANVNAQAGMFGTALGAVSHSLLWPVDNQLVAQLLENAMKPKGQQCSYSAEFRQLSKFEQSVETAKLLLDAGVDITGPGRLLSEIWTASTVENLGVVELLIERGANDAGFGEALVEVLRRLSEPSPQSKYNSNPELKSLMDLIDKTFLNNDDNGNGVNDDDNGNGKANMIWQQDRSRETPGHLKIFPSHHH
ncbi:hypothetical protein V502_11189 [Pseudogymnoascus sp. VKM F-4520 (FW-2644)]|nr:hypothetical protein V502_11189 [Pseudogymnoascus sp. VKM F-4520 (FW-2644)]